MAMLQEPASAMPEDMVAGLVNEFSRMFINLNNPDRYINPGFKIALEPAFDELYSACQLEFAPHLGTTLSSPTPPSTAFFRTLPLPKPKIWAVYAIVLVDPDGKYHLYIGSGTDTMMGCTARTARYKNKKYAQLPHFVRIAYDNGYELSYIGTLCWIPLPAPTFAPLTRLLFLCLEGVFTCLFYSASYGKSEWLWEDKMPWSRDQVSWGHLNSHLPFIEGVGDVLNLTPAELEYLAVVRKEQIARNSKAAETREREANLDAYLLRKRTEMAAWAARNPEKDAATKARTVAKAKLERRFYCTECNIAFATPFALNSHRTTQAHITQVEINSGVPQAEPSDDTLRSREFVRRTKAQKRFFCSICKFNAPCNAKLQIHLTTKGHKAKVAMLASAGLL